MSVSYQQVELHLLWFIAEIGYSTYIGGAYPSKHKPGLPDSLSMCTVLYTALYMTHLVSNQSLIDFYCLGT